MNDSKEIDSLVNRPDALYLSKSNYASPNYVSFLFLKPAHHWINHYINTASLFQSSPVYGTQDYEQKLTPSSRSSTLRRGENKTSTLNKTYTTLPSQPNIYDSISIKTLNQQNNSSATVAADLQLIVPSSAAGPKTDPQSHRPEYLNFERNTLDYRLKPSSAGGVAVADGQHTIDYRSRNGGNSISKNDEFRLSGSDFVSTTTNVDYSVGSSNQMSALMQRVNNSTTLTKNGTRQSRNHIITDTLPGPESCV